MGRLRYVAIRLLQGIAIILAIVVLNFFLLRAAPGDPALAMAGEAGAADAEYIEQLRSDWGLDRPIFEQLAIYVGGVVSLDMGHSYRYGAPVLDVLLERLPSTLLLTVAAFFLALGLGVLLGTVAALKVGSWIDTIVTDHHMGDGADNGAVLRHADLLVRPDEHPPVRGGGELAAAGRLRDHRR